MACPLYRQVVKFDENWENEKFEKGHGKLEVELQVSILKTTPMIFFKQDVLALLTLCSLSGYCKKIGRNPDLL